MLLKWIEFNIDVRTAKNKWDIIQNLCTWKLQVNWGHSSFDYSLLGSLLLFSQEQGPFLIIISASEFVPWLLFSLLHIGLLREVIPVAWSIRICSRIYKLEDDRRLYIIAMEVFQNAFLKYSSHHTFSIKHIPALSGLMFCFLNMGLEMFMCHLDVVLTVILSHCNVNFKWAL